MKRSRQVLTAIFLIAACLFFALSDPSKASSVALIIGFLLLAAALYQIIYGVLTITSWYGLLPSKSGRRRLTVTLTGLLGSLVALQSTGELSHRDVLVLIPLMAGVYLYTYAARTE